MSDCGVLLLNLGTPEKPESKEVGTYLTEFLLDPEVIDIPWLSRQFLVRAVIVPFRKGKSASLYKKIWTEKGSPLAINTRSLIEKVGERLPGITVTYAFRYGNPNFELALQKLEAKGVKNLLVIPLYPQYATSATRTSERHLAELNLEKRFSKVKLIQSFHNEKFYLDSECGLIRKHRPVGSHVLFSFHGIPVRQIQKNHKGCNDCLKKLVCHKEGDALCYRRQCTETAEALALELGLGPKEWTLSYQSRLGRNAWLLPNTEEALRHLVGQGVEDLTVVCAGFVADCLETLEEMDRQGREIFEQAGGKKWTRVPCLNVDPTWVEKLSQWIQSQQQEKTHGTSAPQPTK